MPFTPFQQHLDKAVQRMGNTATMRAIAVCAAYRKVAGTLFGEDLVQHMKPTYRGGILTVQTSKSALLSELKMHEKEILEELTKRLGQESPKWLRVVG